MLNGCVIKHKCIVLGTKSSDGAKVWAKQAIYTENDQ